VAGLDLDIESAQIAAEAQMRVLVERGALESAVTIATRARYQSVQYLERIRSITREAAIDPEAADWADEVPTLLDAALTHVAGRIEAELELRRAVEDQRDLARDPEVRQQANVLIEILHECRQRHTELQRHLLGARTELRAGQDERFRRGAVGALRADLERDYLLPLLGAPGTAVVAFAELLIARTAGVAAPFLPGIGLLVEELLEPPVAPEPGVEVLEPEFLDTDVRPWWEPYWDAAAAFLDAVDTPTLLSTLLARAPTLAAQLAAEEALEPNLLAAAVVHLAHEQRTVTFSGWDRTTRVPFALASGTCLVEATACGDDLTIYPVLLGRELADTRTSHRELT
jgi:hypothetical protein